MRRIGGLVARPEQGGGKPFGSPRGLMGLGIELAVPVALLMYLGHKADGWLDTDPWFLVVGALLGITVGFYNFFRRVLPSGRNPDGEGR